MSNQNAIPITGGGRIGYLDAAKGIGILCVMLGHTHNLVFPINYAAGIVWSFHMPLFFIISGICFRVKDNNQCFKSLFTRLIIPYIFTIALFVSFFLINGDFPVSKEWLISGAYGSGDRTNFVRGVGGIWFLLALFWARLLMNGIARYAEHIIMVLVSLLAYWGIYSYSHVVLPWGIQNGCVGMLFLYIGYQAKKCGLLERDNLSLFVFSFFIWATAFLCHCSGVTLVDCNMKLINVLTSSCACYVVLVVSQYLCKISFLKRILTWLGRSTLIILVFHIFELHANISDNISLFLFNTNDGIVVLFIRLTWCLFFAFIIPRTKYLRKVFIV